MSKMIKINRILNKYCTYQYSTVIVILHISILFSFNSILEWDDHILGSNNEPRFNS